MMDINDTATIVGFGKDFYELELDGIPAILLIQVGFFYYFVLR